MLRAELSMTKRPKNAPDPEPSGSLKEDDYALQVSVGFRAFTCPRLSGLVDRAEKCRILACNG